MVIHIIFLRVFCSAEGPDPCELAQNPRYRKGPDVCFDNNENVRRSHTCAEIIAGSSSISQTSQLASVYFCLVSISAHTAGCLLLHSDPYLIYSFTSFFTYRFVIVFISLPLHALITQSFFAFLLPPVVSPLIIRHSCGSASPPAAALIGQDEPLCPISRGSPLSPAPLLLLLMLCSGSVSSHGSTQLHYWIINSCELYCSLDIAVRLAKDKSGPTMTCQSRLV